MGAPECTSHGEATCSSSAQLGRSAWSCCSQCRDSGVWLGQLLSERLQHGQGRLGQGMAFCTVSPAAGRWLSRMEESQVRRQHSLVSLLWLKPGAGAGTAVRTGPAPRRQQDTAPGTLLPPQSSAIQLPRSFSHSRATGCSPRVVAPVLEECNPTLEQQDQPPGSCFHLRAAGSSSHEPAPTLEQWDSA